MVKEKEHVAKLNTEIRNKIVMKDIQNRFAGVVRGFIEKWQSIHHRSIFSLVGGGDLGNVFVHMYERAGYL